MKTGPIETNLRLLFSENETDVDESLMLDLLSFQFDDRENGEADEISILLKDSDGKWAGTWKPDGGESVKAYLAKGTTTDGGLNRAELYCGRFFVDQSRIMGPPRTFEIRAVSIPLNKPIRKKVKTRAWENQSLKTIAQAIAKEAGIDLLFESDDNPTYDRVDQSTESDLKFLSRLAEEAGLSMKITDDQLVIFDQAYFEKQQPTQTLILGESAILSWSFDNVQSETYRSCTVNYRDPKKKSKTSAGSYTLKEKLDEDVEPSESLKDKLKDDEDKRVNPAVLSYTYVDETVDANGQEYVLKKRVKSISEAKCLAKAKLRELNFRRVRGNLTVVGDVTLVAGIVIACKGFGSFDGNFFIEEASHIMTAGGYTTALRLRRVNNQY